MSEWSRIKMYLSLHSSGETSTRRIIVHKNPGCGCEGQLLAAAASRVWEREVFRLPSSPLRRPNAREESRVKQKQNKGRSSVKKYKQEKLPHNFTDCFFFFFRFSFFWGEAYTSLLPGNFRSLLSRVSHHYLQEFHIITSRSFTSLLPGISHRYFQGVLHRYFQKASHL